MSLLPTVNARGLLAARPAAAASNEGYNYYATDTGILYRSTGATWEVNSSGFANPMTTQGDTMYGGASGAPTRLPIGTAGQVWTVNPGATAPEWAGAGTVATMGVSVERTSDVSIANDTTVAIDWQAEVYDTDSLWVVGSPSFITIPAGGDGVWDIEARVSWAADVDGYRECSIRIDPVSGGANYNVAATRHEAIEAAGIANKQTVAALGLELVAGDVVELTVRHTAGAALNCLAATASTKYGMTVIRRGPLP